MKYYYIAATSEGKKVKGFIEAVDKNKAALSLREHGLMPVRLEKGSSRGMFSDIKFFNKINDKDLIFFTSQISSMLASGLTLSQSLSILVSQVQKQTMLSMINSILINIEEGKSFSEALSEYPDVFSKVHVALIKSSETSGALDKVMKRLSDNLEKHAKLKAQIKSAMLYPVIVIVLMIIVIIIMLTIVVPQLNSLYDSLNVELPLSTKIMVGASEFITNYIVILAIVLVLCLGYFNNWRKSTSGRYMLDKLILKIPLFGRLVAESTIVEFCRTFGMLLGTGALVVESLNRSASVLNNSVYRIEVLKLAKNVEKGVPIGDLMNLVPIFPPILVEMTKVGEQTGKLDEELERVSEYYEREVEQRIKTLTTALEPAIMVCLAFGVGFLMFAVLTPIYQLLNAF